MQALAEEARWAEVPIHASLSIQALRFLRESRAAEVEAEALRTEIQGIEQQALLLYTACQARKTAEAAALLGIYGERIGALERHYDPAVVQAVMYSCAACRGIREIDPATPCPKCGMRLEPRPIPASEIYTTPGTPSIAAAVRVDRPLAPEQTSQVIVRLTRKRDSAPVVPEDLAVMHTERIHLLIVDESLSDYRHEHPRPTDVPGEYAFAFTPRRPGPYRVFADLVPAESRVQEYVASDLPASRPGRPVEDRREKMTGGAEGLQFQLTWLPLGSQLRPKEPVDVSFQVVDGEGKPFAGLEPVMGAFAHFVAFHEDRQTVVHIHPMTAELKDPNLRGGPSIPFRFYAPREGFYRIYAQVQAAGQAIFVPFGALVGK